MKSQEFVQLLYPIVRAIVVAPPWPFTSSATSSGRFERHVADMEAAADELVAVAEFTADEPLVSIIEALARLREDLAGANDKLDALEADPP